MVRVAEARIPTAHGDFLAYGYDSLLDGIEHIALVCGDVGIGDDGEDVLVRVHSECLTGDVLGSLRCDCGPQLDAALEAVAAEGRGVVLYMRGHEGRGIGLMHKLQAYQLQDAGADTVDANLALGLPADARDYGTGAQILVRPGRPVDAAADQQPGQAGRAGGLRAGVPGRVPLPMRPTPENLRYLRTKRDRMGHDLPELGELGARWSRSGRVRGDAAMSGEGRPAGEDCRRRPGCASGVVATRWHAEITDNLLERALAAAAKAGVASRRWCGSPARSSCRWSARSWPAPTTPSSRSAW